MRISREIQAHHPDPDRKASLKALRLGPGYSPSQLRLQKSHQPIPKLERGPEGQWLQAQQESGDSPEILMVEVILGMVLGTEGFLARGTRPGLSASSLRALCGRARSPAGPLVLAATTAALGAAAEAELGLAGAFRPRLGLEVLGGCRARGGSASGSTMQMPGASGSGGGTRGVGSGSLAALSLPASSSESATGTGSESDSVGRDSLTDVGGVSGGRSCERALLSELPGDAGGGGLRCANSQGDTRHRSTSCGEAERRARRKGRLSPASPAGSTCSKETESDSSTSVE